MINFFNLICHLEGKTHHWGSNTNCQTCKPMHHQVSHPCLYIKFVFENTEMPKTGFFILCSKVSHNVISLSNSEQKRPLSYVSTDKTGVMHAAKAQACFIAQWRLARYRIKALLLWQNSDWCGNWCGRLQPPQCYGRSRKGPLKVFFWAF